MEGRDLRSGRSLARLRDLVRGRYRALAAASAAVFLLVPGLAFALIGSGSGLAVAVRPPGSGAVVGPGFDCEDECTYEGEFPATFTAIAKPGYTFKSWTGCEAGGISGSRCTVCLLYTSDAADE